MQGEKLIKLLEQMTLEEKIGQLFQFGSNLFLETETALMGPLQNFNLSKDDVNKMGSVIGVDCAKDMIEIQKKHLESDRNKIPMIFMMDVIHGYRNIYPIPLALGCSFDPDLAEECASIAAKEAAASGIQLTFSPMVDYVRDARWGRVMETYGEDKMLNGLMGAAQIKGYQGDDFSKNDKIATCVKHFAAYGGAEAGRDYNTVEISEKLLREHYLPSYKACINAGAPMVMTSFNSLNGIPSTANTYLMQDILRDEWGFDGVVITDFSAISELITHGIASDKKDAARLAINNGCDIEMYSDCYVSHLTELVNEGKVDIEQIDRSVLKILELKNKLGLFEDAFHGADIEKAEELYRLKSTRDTIKKAAVESAVMLKNEGILPFKKDIKSIALIGPFADSLDIAGFWDCRNDLGNSITVKQGIQNLLPDVKITVVKGCGNLYTDTDTSGFDAAVKAARNADAVVLCIGEPSTYSGEGVSRLDIGLPGVQNELSRLVTKANPNTAVLLFNGRPLVLNELNKCAKAIIEMWFPGNEGGNAAAELLFGESNPSGKLTISFPKNVGQCPLYYDHPNTGRPRYNADDEPSQRFQSNYLDGGNLPLFSFGHGLSYSKFEYRSLSLSSNVLTDNDPIIAKVTVKNTSNIGGKETVMLFFRDIVASTVRPIQQLLAFKKVYFKAGEEKTIEFEINKDMLEIWDKNNCFTTEKGLFKLYTGYADNLIFETEFEYK